MRNTGSRFFAEIFLYLDREASEQSLGIAVVQLVIADEEAAIARARTLIDRTRWEIADETQEREFLKLID